MSMPPWLSSTSQSQSPHEPLHHFRSLPTLYPAVQLFGPTILAASLHGGWWGAVTAVLCVSANYACLPSTACAILCAVVGVLRVLPLLISIPCTGFLFLICVLNLLAPANATPRSDRDGCDMPTEDSTFWPLSTPAPPGAPPTVLAVLRARNYYEVRHLYPS